MRLMPLALMQSHQLHRGQGQRRHKASLVRLCAESRWPYTPPASEETMQKRGDRRRKLREGHAEWVLMHVGTEGAPFTDVCAKLRARGLTR